MKPEELKKKKDVLENQILSSQDLEALNELEGVELRGGNTDSVNGESPIWDNFICGFLC
ncbi:hypothetical protein [Parabacteroides sp. Marseille-P3160]|uniref:hypothetical protein n=1 Tax=Parabacteroides sp. Marseille-P3160 TaxID=1917887 RepID=UPI001358D2EB|nr:hypothetical protein [Parabacteroides sp. Marseille-P3160]